MTFGYIIPNIYVFIRIWQLFISKEHRLAYVLVYLLIASIYPLSNILDGGDFLEKVTDYLLPYYLYLFLFVLLLDIILLLNYVFKIISAGELKNPSLRKILFRVILILPLAVVGIGIINFKTIRTSEYSIEIPSKASKAKHIKIAFLADFHLQEGIDIGFVKRFAEKIEEINPDIILYGGDIVEDRRSEGDTTAYEKIIRKITARHGSYAVLGNHEHYSGHDRGSFHDKTNITLLRDTVVIVDNLFNLAGRNDRERKSIDDILKLADDSLPVILIDHRPTDIINISKTAVDVSFSGHTHNGQMFPINLIVKSMYELSHGYRMIGNTHFFVTSGIRLWGPPVRTTGKSEIVVVNIEFTGN